MRRLKRISLLERCDVSGFNNDMGNGELAAWSGKRSKVMRERKMRTVRDRGSSSAHACACARTRVPFARQCVRDSRALLPLLPPTDGFRVVVASAARAVCADRAMFRGLPRRSTKLRLPSSFVALSPDPRPQADEHQSFLSEPDDIFSLTRAGITVAPASSFGMRKQWHTR